MKKILFIFLSLSFFFAACTSDAGADQKTQLQGKWVFESASIDGNLEDGTDLLAGTTFSFTEEQLSSNLLTDLGLSSNTSAYSVKEGKIIVENNTISFDIEQLDENKLALSFSFSPADKAMLFKINLTKQ